MEAGLDRRSFISRSAAVVGGGLLSAGAVERLVARDALGARRPHGEPYGPLRRTPDQRGVEVLALPAGFSYVTFSHTGSTMSDGNPTPLALDGMSAFAGGHRHGHGHGHGQGHGHGRHDHARAPGPQLRGPQPGGRRTAACSATAARPTTPTASAAPRRWSTTSAATSWSRTSSASTARSSTAPAGAATGSATG